MTRLPDVEQPPSFSPPRPAPGDSISLARARWLRWRWTVATAGAVLLALAGLVAHGDLWELIGVYHLDPYFADLAAVFAAGQAHVAGLDVYQINPFDPFGRPHVYGPLWLLSGPLGLTVADAMWAGALLGFAFLAVALLAAAPRTPGAALVTTLVLLSPPVLLGVNRANNDLVIFLLFAVAAVLAARSGRWRVASGAGILVLAAALKYYPLVALPALAARPGRIRQLALLGLACAAVFAVIWWVQRADFDQALAIAPRPKTIFAYGFSLIPYAWDNHVMHRGWHLAGMALGALVAGGLLWGGGRNAWSAIPLLGARAFCAVAGGTSWVFCYFANTNYPYRTILLLLVLPCWLALAAERGDVKAARTGRGMCSLFLLSLWLAAPKNWWAEIFLSGNADAPRASYWVVAVFGAEQILWLTLTAAVAVSLAGWAWRRAQAGPI